MISQLHQLTDQVKLLQKVALILNGKVLLLQRSAATLTRPNQWDLPGGNSEWPTVDSAALVRGLHLKDLIREVKEETGVDLSNQVDSSLSPVHIETTYDPASQKYSIIVGWALHLHAETKEPTLSSEHQAYEWVPLSESKEFDFGFAGGENGFITAILRKAEQQLFSTNQLSSMK